MRQILIFIVISLLGTSCFYTQKAASTMPPTMTVTSTAIIAHRGAWKNTQLPENSVAAFKAAIAMDCYGSEMDVHMTDDGYIVVNHDPDYNKMDIQKSTLADLRRFKLSNGESLPLLSDFLEILTKQNKTKLIVEIKPSVRGKEWAMKTTRKVVDEINAYNAGSQVAYISFDFDICKEILKYAPDATVQYLKGDKTPHEIQDAKLSGLDYHYSVYKDHPEYLTEAKELGLQTNAWTVNDVNMMDWLIEQEINFITTNEPELLLERINKWQNT